MKTTYSAERIAWYLGGHRVPVAVIMLVIRVMRTCGRIVGY